MARIVKGRTEMNEMDQFIDNSKPEDSQLQRLVAMGEDMIAYESKIQQLESLLEATKKLYDNLATNLLPEAMLEANIRDFTLMDRSKIAIKDLFVVRINKVNMEKADAWLNEHGHAGMIKKQLQAELPRDYNETKIDLLRSLLATYDIKMEVALSAHWATIQSFANEMEKAGEYIPEDIFSVFRGRKAIVE